MKKWFGIACAVTLIALAALLPVEARDGFRPDWRAGDKWEVSATYFRGERAAEAWSEPETWIYQVSEGTGKEGNAALVIKIQAKDEEAEPWTEIHLDGGTRAVTKVLVRRAGAFEKPLVMKNPEPGVPVPTGLAPTPVDIPAFPLIPGEVREFEYLRKVAGGLFAREVIRQEVKQVESYGGDGQEIVKEDLLEVTCSDGSGREIFSQRWVNGCPWPLSGRNESMKYRLVRP